MQNWVTVKYHVHACTSQNFWRRCGPASLGWGVVTLRNTPLQAPTLNLVAPVQMVRA